MSEYLPHIIYAVVGMIGLAATMIYLRSSDGIAILDVLIVVVLGVPFGVPLTILLWLLIGASTDVLTRPRWFLRR